ncbi:MAG: N-6 DNA methylase [Proteobacteria bacterium]|nr:N-6 DNA methylase [Pseudomonadota bacterium]
MQVEQFISKWRNASLGEHRSGSGAVQHFLDLCDLLGVEKPSDADNKAEWYCFERGARKTTGKSGWADVWKRGHFGWEYKGNGSNLDKAFAQLQQYAVALENPPLLVVSDMERIIIHTNFTNTVSQVHEIGLEDLRDAHKRDVLLWVFTDPDRLKPDKTIQALTDAAAQKFAELALRIRNRGHEPEQVAHFINRLAFCMFAEDVNLLPRHFFTERLYKLVSHPERIEPALKALFSAMAKGGMYGDEPIEWFNGGLFDDNAVLPLEREDIALLYEAAKMDWQDIDPSIFGTLFERGLDPEKRSQLGAHYTDAEKIMMIVEPVIIQPLLREWEDTLQAIEKEFEKESTAKRAKDRADAAKRSFARMEKLRSQFLVKLENFQVLDPACGSGNFLYIALKALKDIEHRVYLESEVYGLPKPALMRTGPHNMRGIELNSYAAELARMTVWIGEIQWCLKHGWQINKQPILKPLKTIENRDALISADGKEAIWPAVDVIIGNPPFLGNKKMIAELGEEYTNALRTTYKGRLSNSIDLVCYWFDKADQLMRESKAHRVGLVATNSISGGKNRDVLKVICKEHHMFNVWRDEPWTVEGAAVRVALVMFAQCKLEDTTSLDGEAVEEIFSDLTGNNSGKADLSTARQLESNLNLAYQGTIKGGAFDISYGQAKEWLQLPLNPNGQPNSGVVRPWANGMDVTRRPEGKRIIDFGTDMTKEDASLYEAPYAYVLEHVEPIRSKVRREGHAKYWWRHGEARPGMRNMLAPLSRYLATPRVAKHRIFVWKDRAVLPDSALIAIARDDDTTFGILHSRFHELWSLRMCTYLGVGNDPRYTPSTTFETFPFPEGLEPNRPASKYANNPRAQKIAQTAQRLNELRENWLNPPDLIKREPEVVEGYPDRLLPIDDRAATILKKRTLTNLYNERPTWLANAHRALDEAVAEAYGWNVDMTDDEVLAALLDLNLKRSDK